MARKIFLMECDSWEEAKEWWENYKEMEDY